MVSGGADQPAADGIAAPLIQVVNDPMFGGKGTALDPGVLLTPSAAVLSLPAIARRYVLL